MSGHIDSNYFFIILNNFIQGMDVDLDELRANMKKFGMDVNDLDWINNRRKIKAVTIFFYETSV